MKIFSWMQNKPDGKARISKPNSASATDHIMHQTCKEELSDEPNGLFSIGTFGNSTLKHTHNSNLQQSLSSCQDLPIDDLQLEKHIDSLPSLEHDETSDGSIRGDSENKDGDSENKDADGNLQRSISVGRSRESDTRLHCTAYGICKKSLSFLLKKTLLCGGGFSSTPIRRDLFPETKLDKQRTEKILGAALQKKIYPRRCAAKKYLDMAVSHGESDGSKWVKTDSNC